LYFASDVEIQDPPWEDLRVLLRSPPVFYYDLSSPYAYLTAARIDEVLPVAAEWRPIAFGVIVKRLARVPWSFAEDRSGDFEEIAWRASSRGLPPVRYPPGWPVETYSLIPLRAAILADGQPQLRALTAELYRTAFVEGRHLADLETVLEAAERVGMDRAELAAGMAREETKAKLRAATEAALARGVMGVPTVVVGDALFWGDDRLQDAAAAAAAV
jgi:2-hydroxychromene-2-carboxylate isomerase